MYSDSVIPIGILAGVGWGRDRFIGGGKRVELYELGNNVKIIVRMKTSNKAM